MEEAATIAQFLGVNVKEVLRHAGVAIDLDGQPTRILLIATIDGYGRMTRLKTPRSLPQATIDRAHAAIGLGNERVIAAQVRADDGPLALFDDAVILFRQTEGIDAGSVGSLCVGRSIDGNMGIGRILKARKTGEMVTLAFDGKIYESEALMSTPVIAILP